MRAGWFGLGCVLAAIGVGLGAWSAHGLDKYCVEKYPPELRHQFAGMETPLSWKRLNDFRTGVEYQMWHSLGLMAAGMAASRRKWAVTLAGMLFLMGIVCFSGSLYALTLTGNTKFGMVAPIGGLAYILGWLSLGMAGGLRREPTSAV